MRPLSVITTFSGIGMQEKGLKKVFDINVIATSEINKNAILSYAAIHNNLNNEVLKSYAYPSKEEMVKELVDKNIGADTNTNWVKVANKKDDTELKKYWLATHLSKNMGDIRKILSLLYADMLTFSFPCTDISIAGNQKGVSYEDWKNGVSTRSGLVWEIVRLLHVAKKNNTLPKFLLMENVSALLSKKFIGEFENLNRLITEIGYNVYYKEINAKDTGIPQNRPRVFGVYIRKDIDNKKFEFPTPFDNGVRLKDLLENNVDEKYYLNQQMQDKFTITDKHFLSTTANKCQMIGRVDIKGMDIIKRVYSPEGIAPALTTMQGGHRQPKIIQPRLLQVGYVDSNKQGNRVYSTEGISCCLNANTGGYGQTSSLYITEDRPYIKKQIAEFNNKQYYIRKLTPKECFLLMGLTEEDFFKCSNMGLSDSSLYKQAGNGLVTNCITLIAEKLVAMDF